MLIYCTEILDRVVADAIAHYPDESCGILVGAKGQNSVSEFHPCRNIYDEMHARYPETYPRTARSAYLIDPKEQQRLFAEAEKKELEVKVLYHSHIDHDAYFSEEDQLVAAPWGEPSYPGISYLVVSVWDKRLKEMNEYCWEDEKKDFLKRRIHHGHQSAHPHSAAKNDRQ